MLRNSSRLINQLNLKIDDKSIKILVNQIQKLNTLTTNDINLENLKGCPFHKHQDQQNKPIVATVNQESSFNSSLKQTTNKPISFTDKIRNLFKSNTQEEQLDFLRIPRTASFMPGLTSILRLSKNGGVANLHKHCNKLHKKFGSIYREQLGPVEGVFIADDELIKEVFSQEDENPTHLIPEPWTLYNEIKKVQRGLFFL